MMPAPVERVLAALRRAGHQPRQQGAAWSCTCPAHDDRTPSLSIGTGDNGGAVVYCHAGCPVEAVVGAVGLRLSDLMPIDVDTNGLSRPRGRVVSMSTPPRGPRRSPAGATGVAPAGPAAAPRGPVYSTSGEAVAAREARLGPASAAWTYHDAAGRPEGIVLRWDRKDGRKTILPVSRREEGWVLEGMRSPRPLYRLPELAAAERVYICEGEKACEAARAMGLVATTSAHGAKSAHLTDWSPLAGKDIVILPDNDPAGERYAAEVMSLLGALSPAPTVCIVRLPDLPAAGDAVEFLAARGGDADAARAEVEALADAAEPETIDPTAPLAYRAFPVDALPGAVGRFVAEGAKAIGCDASFIALPMLASLAAAIGHTRRLRLKRGWTEPVVVWIAIVGESGTQKTPAFKLVLRPLREVQAEMLRLHEKQMEEYEVKRLTYEAELTAWKRRAGKGNAGDPPEEPEVPVATRYIVSDTTVEALAPILLENPRGVLMARDELSGWIGSFDRYTGSRGGGGADAGHWLSMHNAEPLVVDRKTGKPRTIYVPAGAVSVAGGIQPGILHRALGTQHRENGLAARLLLACPPRKAKRWTEAELDERTEAAVERIVARLLTLEADAEEAGQPAPRVLELSPEAKRLWVAFYNEHAAEQAGLSGDLSAAWSKLEAYAPRLALLVHLCRRAEGDLSLEDENIVDERSMAAGIAMVRWFAAEARRIYAMLDEQQERGEQEGLETIVRRHNGSITARELMRASSRFAKGTADDAEAALAALVAAGKGYWVTDDHGGGRGRPARRFVLGRADGVDTDTNGPSPGEEGICVNVNDAATAAVHRAASNLNCHDVRPPVQPGDPREGGR
jgi:hypothetical protein